MVSFRKIASYTALVVFGLTLAATVNTSPAQAEARFSGAEAAYVAAGETIDGNAYLAGNSIRVEGTVNGDVYCAGSSIVITGTVNGDVHCAGQTLTIGGHVNGSVQAAGQSITLNGVVGGGVAAYGSTVTAESAASIGRDLTVGGMDVVLNGTVARDVIGGAEQMTIGGQIGRNVHGEYTKLKVAADGTIGGFLQYTAPNDAAVEGKVAGETKRFASDSYRGQHAYSPLVELLTLVMTCIVWTVMIALLLLFAAPKKLRTATNLTPRDLIVVFALGFMALFAAPIVLIFLALTVVGLPIALVALVVWLLLLMVSCGVTSYYLGRLLLKTLHPVAATVLAAVLLSLSFAIPFLNILTMIGSAAFGMGALLYAVRGEYEAPHGRVRLAKVQKA